MDLISYGDKTQARGLEEMQEELREMLKYITYLIGNSTFTKQEYDQNTSAIKW